MTIVDFPSDVDVCASHIDATINSIFLKLETLAKTLVGIWETAEADGLTPSSKDLSPLRELIDSYLLADDSCIQGTGVVLEPGVLEDSGMYLEWLRVAAPNRTAPLTLNFNQRSESFYNYQNMPWFSQPKATGQNVVIGPYVDLYGADMYILTFAAPIQVEGRFIGIAGADIALNRFERLLLADLLKLQNEALIVSEEGRVIASNTANWMVGDMARHAFNRLETECKQVELGSTSAHWSLIARPTKRVA
ncbi:PDC sensor domain-containing protein [Pseudomonas guariconensis]|jgi:hypothetical protein|uniref:cache domain-containing protein n=1 Tax=Pseudomonas guariconensis TaxID=1288410 RepID=UPI0018AA7966|nr:cache domain-containing protein [Pseudomonas guariconensis]MBF8728920.1 PDC sensor domain-containing protein [Pseudomonas guariconensis]